MDELSINSFIDWTPNIDLKDNYTYMIKSFRQRSSYSGAQLVFFEISSIVFLKLVAVKTLNAQV